MSSQLFNSMFYPPLVLVLYIDFLNHIQGQEEVKTVVDNLKWDLGRIFNKPILQLAKFLKEKVFHPLSSLLLSLLFISILNLFYIWFLHMYRICNSSPPICPKFTLSPLSSKVQNERQLNNPSPPLSHQ